MWEEWSRVWILQDEAGFHPAVKPSVAFEGRRPQKHAGLLNMRNMEVIATLQSHTASGSRYPHAL